ncbi:MAG: hypothetical protein RMJ97_05840 [Raineya sp.]|nr:hypothetical protein [Raineya sp.]MDW8296393.1 hypothetical protein [Raineya sp.]
MKKVTFGILLAFFPLLSLAQQERQQEMMIITTVEYMDFLDGSFSKMYVNYPDGKTEEIELKGLWSFGRYISEKKVKANDRTVMNKINELLKAGWRIAMVSSSTQPRTSEANASPSSILTRYVLVR